MTALVTLERVSFTYPGVAAPALTGLVVQRTGSFFWAFAVAPGVVLAGAGLYLFVIGPIVQVDWSRRRA